MPIALLLKVISNIGSLSGDLKDFEQGVADLKAGKLSKADVDQLLKDIADVLAMGLVPLPGVDMQAVISTLKSGESVVEDIMQAVSDVKSQGVSAIVPDLKKAIGDVIIGIDSGLITHFGASSAASAKQILSQIEAGL